MTECQKNKRFSLVNLIGNVWGAHIVIAALLYPRPFLPGAADDFKETAYEIVCLGGGTMLLLINLAGLVLLFTRTAWIDAAKIIFVFLIWLAIGVIYIAFNHLRDIQSLLVILEEAAMQSRDEAAMVLRAANTAVQNWHSRLIATQEVELSVASILKRCAPLALLILRKEKSMVHIGVEAFKLVLSSTHLFKKLF
jgi:hypothetical protein